MIRKQLVKDNKKKNIYFFLLFIVVILAYHFLLREYIGDFREMFSPLMDTDTLGEALRKRYETWSSRVFIEAHLFCWRTIMAFYYGKFVMFLYG